jgi:hypothetical protein
VLWNWHKRKEEIYKIGDQVLVQADYLPSDWTSRKLDNQWRGPFPILSKKGSSAYKIGLPTTWKGHRTLNASHLKCYMPPFFPGQDGPNSWPDPIITSDRKEEYEVHEILDERRRNGRTEYLVQWKDYSPKDDTWEPEQNLTNARDTLCDYRTWGWVQGEVRHHVAAIKNETSQIKPGLIRIWTSLMEGMSQVAIDEWEEWDNGPSVKIDAIRSELTRKLCRRALVLIKHKVGADVDISEHMVRALETWLCRWGITIYTEPDL